MFKHWLKQFILWTFGVFLVSIVELNILIHAFPDLPNPFPGEWGALVSLIFAVTIAAFAARPHPDEHYRLLAQKQRLREALLPYRRDLKVFERFLRQNRPVHLDFFEANKMREQAETYEDLLSMIGYFAETVDEDV